MGYDDIILREYYAREEERDNKWDEIEASLTEQWEALGKPSEFRLVRKGFESRGFEDIDEAVTYAANADYNDTWSIEEE